MTWESLDWEVLDRLRETFLSGDKTAGPYWHTITDLECYDFTYGERIGWKWDAALRELKARRWSPFPGARATPPAPASSSPSAPSTPPAPASCSPGARATPPANASSYPGARATSPANASSSLGARATSPANPTRGELGASPSESASQEPSPPRAHPIPILDWGCGSGIAGRRVIEFFGAENFSRLVLHDHSTLAMDFAEHRARQSFPSLPVERASYRELNGSDSIGLLVVSHVVNELTEIARAELAGLCARAHAILWVEPGTHEVSRQLGAWREQLRDQFRLVAPCPHQLTCGVLRPGNERHWCHFFAPPPAGVYADSGWVRFGQRAGIDLRALPYSFLAVDRNGGAQLDCTLPPATAPDSSPSVIIGEARHYKGYAKLFNCDANGVEELMLQKRDAPVLFKELKHGAGPSLHRWSHENGRITRIESNPSPEEPG